MDDSTNVKESQLAKGHPGNRYGETHGIRTFEARGEAALNPFEVSNLADLRALVKTDPGRKEIKDEVVCRLVIIVRKFFADMEANHKDPNWWNSGCVARGGTYLAELRRWLDTYSNSKEEINALLLDAIRSAEEVSHGQNTTTN